MVHIHNELLPSSKKQQNHVVNIMLSEIRMKEMRNDMWNLSEVAIKIEGSIIRKLIHTTEFR